MSLRVHTSWCWWCVLCRCSKEGAIFYPIFEYTQSFENSLNGCASLFSALFLPRPPSMHCAFSATRPVMNTVAKCMLRPVLVWSSLSIYSSLELYIIHCPLQLYFLCVRKGFVKDACHTINLYAVSISRMCCPCRSFRALFIQRKSRSLPNSIEATHTTFWRLNWLDFVQ